MLDIPYARKVLEFAEAEHHGEDVAYDQGVWFQTRAAYIEHELFAPPTIWDKRYGATCQTVACLAGAAVMFDPHSEIKLDAHGELRVTVDGKPSDVVARATELMGLTPSQAFSCFYEGDAGDALGSLRRFIAEAEAEQAL